MSIAFRVTWKPLDDDARDGREVLLRTNNGHGFGVLAAYYGLAQRAHGVGATRKHPWVMLDGTNGVNHRIDDESIVGYVALDDLA